MYFLSFFFKSTQPNIIKDEQNTKINFIYHDFSFSLQHLLYIHLEA